MWCLEIEKLGPIEHIALDESNLVLLIGPQASGKSTLAKALYFFLSFHQELINYCFLLKAKEHLLENLWIEQSKRVFQLWDPESLAFAQLRFTFRPEIFLEISGDEVGLVKIKGSEQFEREAQQIMLGWRDAAPSRGIQLLSLDESVRTMLAIEQEVFFIPAGRSMLSQLQGQVMPVVALDYTMQVFANLVNNFGMGLTPFFRMILAGSVGNAKRGQLALGVCQKLLKGEFRHEKEGRLFFDELRSLPLNKISSGQQEALWIAIFLVYWITMEEKYFLIVEEPEAHLYPEGQRDMAFLLSMFFSNGGRGMITTHSPYLLGAFNNHMYAFQLGQKVGEAVSAVIPKDAWIDPQGVQGYFLDKGHAQSIIDQELGLLKSEAVDSASGLIGQEYEALFDLDDAS